MDSSLRFPDDYLAEGAAILDEVRNWLCRFVAYPSEAACIAHTLWIAHTHAMGAWESTPRIFFSSPEPGSGKSRCLEATEPLVPNPIEAASVSAAYLYRKVAAAGDELPTVLFDEVDCVFTRTGDAAEDIRAMVNAGHRRGAKAGRCVIRGKTIETEELPAYCALAMAGLNDLPDTILSRSVIIRMRRRAPGERVEPYRRRDHAPIGNRIRDRLAAWAADALPDLEGARPEMPDCVTDRNADVWEALLSIADLAGGNWLEMARVAAVTFVTHSEDKSSLGVQLLTDLRTAFEDRISMWTDDVLHALHALPESIWADIRGKPLNDRGLAQRLKRYGVKPKPIRVGDNVGRGYARADLLDAWARYCPPVFPAGSVTCVTSETKVDMPPSTSIEDDPFDLSVKPAGR